MARKLILVGLLSLAFAAKAGTVAGTGGSTEITQIMNNLQLVQSYEQQVAGYVRQGLQLENELKHLIANPTSMLGQDIGNLINQVGRIMSAGQSIGYNVEQIDRNFAKTFKSPTATSFADRFKSWHQTNTDTLESVLKSIGTRRAQYQSNQEALTDLYNRSQATQGSLQAAQTLAQINIRQVQELQSLQDLLSTQAQAEAVYMQTQTSRQNESLAADEGAKKLLDDVPTGNIKTQNQPVIDWSKLTRKK